MMKRGLTLLLCLTLLLGVTACKSDAPTATGTVDIWGAPATEKILADKPGAYESIRQEAAVRLVMAKNEYESSQIILTPDHDVKSYDVSVSELRHTNGTDTIPASAIGVYVEKYLSLGVIYDAATGAAPGKYPDALLPIAAAKAYGETTVAKDTNQGLYITVKTAADQQPGGYTGALTLTVDGKETSIPVSVEVVDLTVSEENHAKSIFLSVRLFQSGELDGSQDIMDKYTARLIDYRLAPHIIVTDTKHTAEDIAYYTDKAYEFMKDPRCSNISIPYATAFLDEEMCFDPEIMKGYVRSFVRKSVAENFDMLKKSVCYFSLIDEPQMGGFFHRTQIVAKYYRQTIDALVAEVAADPTVPEGALKQSILQSIRSLRNVVTCEYLANYAPYIDTWCPQVQHYDTEALRANYADQEEKWWYTCSQPRAPYPTYHTEDTLLSARALSWMQAEYGVTGNLFWAVSNYANYNGSYYENIEDYYSGDAQRFVTVNGDGYLFYPGGQYGLEQPVASLRLEAIRDGLEEYELLYAMRERYAEIATQAGTDFGAGKAIAGLTGLVYNGTKVVTTSAKFASARASLFQLAACAQSAAGMCVVDYTDDSYGNITYKVFLKDGYTLQNHGQNVPDGTAVTGGKIYEIRTQLSQANNRLALSYECDGKTYRYEQTLGGKATVYAAADLANAFSAQLVTPSTSLVTASEVAAGLTGSLVRIDMPASSGKSQSIKMSADFIANLGPDDNRVVYHIYNPNGAVTCSFAVKYTKKTTLIDIASVTLQPGMNTVELPVGTINWSGLGRIENLSLIFGQTKDEPERTMYCGDVTVYAV